MTTVTLRPDGTIDAGTVTGAASTHAATNDNSDASYVGTATSFQVTLGTSALPAGAITKQCRARARHADYGASKTITLRWGDTDLALLFVGGDTTTVGESVGAWFPQTLSQDQINELRIRVACDTAASRTHELYGDLVYVAQPVVAVAAVSPDPYTATNLVPITWVNTLDADGGGQTHFQMRVFTAAQYGIGGFDPATSPATYDSLINVWSSSGYHTPALPTATTYRAYVRVAQTVNGAQHWSAYAFDQFTVNVTTSDVLSVTTVASNSTGSIAVTVNRNTGTAAWDLVDVDRSIDGGVTWSNVRGASYVDATANPNTFTVTDYEVPNGTTVKYRANATRIVSGLQITGVNVESASTSWSSIATWLKVPGTPALNLAITTREFSSLAFERRRGVFQVLGLANPVITSDVASGALSHMAIGTTSVALVHTLHATLAAASVFLIQKPPTHDSWNSRYVSIGSWERTPLHDQVPNGVMWTVCADIIEVDPPADPLAGA